MVMQRITAQFIFGVRRLIRRHEVSSSPKNVSAGSISHFKGMLDYLVHDRGQSLATEVIKMGPK